MTATDPTLKAAIQFMLDSRNPRLLLWLRTKNLPVSVLRRDAEGRPQIIEDMGLGSTWTTAYSRWIMRQWRAWAESLGYSVPTSTRLVRKMQVGFPHTADDFDAWLAARFAHCTNLPNEKAAL